jgi:uncharacterized protein YbjT (DUF2867 family)
MILVTGASGNVGTALVARLRSSGHEFRAAYHSASTAQKATDAGIDAVTIEMSDPDTLVPALAGVSRVFLLGAMSPEQTINEVNVVNASIAAGVRHIVKQSVWRADEELTPIARLHRPVERLLAEAPIEWTFLRSNFYMQTFSSNWAEGIRANSVFASPLIRGPISFVDVNDIARVAERALTEDRHHHKIYVLTGPAALSYEQAAGVLSDVLGRPVTYTGLSDEQARDLLPQFGVSLFETDALVEVCTVYRDAGAETITSTVAELTGQEPTSFEQFVVDHQDLFR